MTPVHQQQDGPSLGSFHSPLAVVCLSLLIWTGSLHAQAWPGADVIPLEVGNRWTYDGTVWWIPPHSMRVLQERVTLEIEVVDVVEARGVRAALLKGYPQDLVVPGFDRFGGDYVVLQRGAAVYLLRGERVREAMRRLRDADDPLDDLVRYSELLLQLPLRVGSEFCRDVGREVRRLGCWIVRSQHPADLTPVRGLGRDGIRQRYLLELRTRAEHQIRSFVPGVGFTSWSIGQSGNAAALELALVEASVGGRRHTVFLKTLDLEDSPLQEAASTTGAADPIVPPSAARNAVSIPSEPSAPLISTPVPPSDADGDGVADSEDRCRGSGAGEVVDRHGCPLTAPVRILDRRARDRGPGVLVSAAEIPVPQAPRLPTCVDADAWVLPIAPVEFDDRRFVPVGLPEPIASENIAQVGEFLGVPLYTGRRSEVPHRYLWLPVCGAPGHYRLFTEEPAGPSP